MGVDAGRGSSSRRLRIGGALVIAGIVILTAVGARSLFSPAPDLPVVGTTTVTNPGGPAMCPWREPDRDMKTFFPGSTSYRLETLVLSRVRPQILKRLGPKYHMETTALYAYRVLKESEALGTVLVRRTAGRYGAIEVVVGVDGGRIAGVHLQRLREPKKVAEALTSARWLDSFKGKTSTAALEPGKDLPVLSAEAQETAQAVSEAVRALLIEFEEGERAVKAAGHH